MHKIKFWLLFKLFQKQGLLVVFAVKTNLTLLY